jgi:hypothetical protein
MLRTNLLQIVVSMNLRQTKGHKLKRVQAETSAELDPSRPAILDRAFKGEL